MTVRVLGPPVIEQTRGVHRVLLLTVLVVAVTACGSPGEPAGTAAAGPSEHETPAVSADSAPDGGFPPGCPPPDPGAEGDAWLCVVETTPDPQAERERLAALAKQRGGWSEEDAQRADAERLREVMAGHPELTAEDDAAAASGELPADRGSLLIRTDFTHPAQWEALLTAVRTPSPEGFVPYLSTVDHQRWAGASVADIAAAAPPHVLLVIADATALSSPQMPLLVLEVREEGTRELRVAPGALASVENNLSIANVDWEEFAGAADPDGVFRGFD
ncbi:hypothetical protein Krad_2825 [Kineococcus radiotolerans SRS30216 = ATCC BAA-149]|uniref:DUF6924 domain-containing protein n=1 Tax=Kineococcus radiotolerans (strain ATCC BAA-149 / DSM 14245 / SRS30216) TaxID=266940 RepID=A6WBV4_KINRD|nr:hypothetical protein Krad_2825 [Kineococcus radiotolerans SRS30216 = ATCC BAA-149]